jgi:RNA polymerase sigma factor (sigma-70 family)
MRPPLRYLAAALAGCPADARTDDQLLGLYRACRDEAAFAALVARHGPLVLGVCGRLLRHREDAEDAFQATFLVLAKKAADLRAGAPLGSWLYGVASRLARHARRARGRRQARERQCPPRPGPDDGPAGHDALGALDEELARLPEPLRAPLLLCYLGGRTHRQAAAQLGWSVATLRRRLEQARERLRLRLARRGVAPAALLAVTPDAATTASAAALAGSTARAALAGAVSPSVLALTQKGLQTMLPTKTKLGVALALALALGAGLAAHQALVAQSPRATDVPPAARGADVADGAASELPRPGGAGAPDLDRHLADVENRLEAALKEVRAARQALKGAPADVTTFPLKRADAERAADVLRAAYPGGQVRVTTDARTNAVIVQAGAADTRAIRRLLEALDAKEDAGTDGGPGKNRATGGR